MVNLQGLESLDKMKYNLRISLRISTFDTKEWKAQAAHFKLKFVFLLLISC